jgi:protein-S-isoprenylcysteine O-methyltransferase Ste14
MEVRKMEKKESKVKDLVERIERGEITPKDGFKELEKRGLLVPERWEIIPWVIYLILWLPLNFMFSDRLHRIYFPPIVIYILLAIGLLGILLWIPVTHMHYKRGGLNHDETVILFKEGIYGVIRHPAVLGFMILPILLPIILSVYVPFSLLSVAAILVMIIYIYYGVHLEEKMDIEKWGNEYRQYMKEVPRFNFILGIWRWARRKRS